MVLTQVIKSRVYKHSFTLNYPPNLDIELALQLRYPHVDSLTLLSFNLDVEHRYPYIHLYNGLIFCDDCIFV